MNFNLIDESWIPVLFADGRYERIGIGTALSQAGHIRQIAASNPMDNVALLRFLLAVVMWKCLANKVIGQQTPPKWGGCSLNQSPNDWSIGSPPHLWGISVNPFRSSHFLHVTTRRVNDPSKSEEPERIINFQYATVFGRSTRYDTGMKTPDSTDNALYIALSASIRTARVYRQLRRWGVDVDDAIQDAWIQLAPYVRTHQVRDINAFAARWASKLALRTIDREAKHRKCRDAREMI